MQSRQASCRSSPRGACEEIKGEWLLMLAGLLSVALGIILLGMLLFAPAPTLLVLAWIIGIWALASGISLLFLAFRLRKARGESDQVQEG